METLKEKFAGKEFKVKPPSRAMWICNRTYSQQKSRAASKIKAPLGGNSKAGSRLQKNRQSEVTFPSDVDSPSSILTTQTLSCKCNMHLFVRKEHQNGDTLHVQSVSMTLTTTVDFRAATKNCTSGVQILLLIWILVAKNRTTFAE